MDNKAPIDNRTPPIDNRTPPLDTSLLSSTIKFDIDPNYIPEEDYQLLDDDSDNYDPSDFIADEPPTSSSRIDTITRELNEISSKVISLTDTKLFTELKRKYNSILISDGDLISSTFLLQTLVKRIDSEFDNCNLESKLSNILHRFKECRSNKPTPTTESSATASAFDVIKEEYSLLYKKHIKTISASLKLTALVNDIAFVMVHGTTKHQQEEDDHKLA